MSLKLRKEIQQQQLRNSHRKVVEMDGGMSIVRIYFNLSLNFRYVMFKLYLIYNLMVSFRLVSQTLKDSQDSQILSLNCQLRL